MSGKVRRRRFSIGNRDANEQPIMREFERLGADPKQLAPPQPDLLVGFLGRNHLVEIKVDNAALNPEQVVWHRDWKGEKPVTVRTPPQAKKWIAVWTREWAASNKPDSDSWVDLAAGGRK